MLGDVQGLIRKYGSRTALYAPRVCSRCQRFFTRGLPLLNTSLHEGIHERAGSHGHGFPQSRPGRGLEEIVTDGVGWVSREARNPRDFAERCLSPTRMNHYVGYGRAAREKIVGRFPLSEWSMLIWMVHACTATRGQESISPGVHGTVIEEAQKRYKRVREKWRKWLLSVLFFSFFSPIWVSVDTASGGWVRGKEVTRADFYPSVTFIVTVHNEEKRIKISSRTAKSRLSESETPDPWWLQMGHRRTSEIVRRYSTRGAEIMTFRAKREGEPQERPSSTREEYHRFQRCSYGYGTEGFGMWFPVLPTPRWGAEQW